MLRVLKLNYLKSDNLGKSSRIVIKKIPFNTSTLYSYFGYWMCAQLRKRSKCLDPVTQ